MSKPIDPNAINVRQYSSESEPQTIFATQAATVATRTSGTLTNYIGRGLILHVNLANLGGAPTFRLLVDWVDNSGFAQNIYGSTNMTTNGDYAFGFYPGWANTGGMNDAQQIPLPRQYRVRLTYSGNGSTDKADTTVYGDILI